jgi:hypothetical protein
MEVTLMLKRVLGWLSTLLAVVGAALAGWFAHRFTGGINKPTTPPPAVPNPLPGASSKDLETEAYKRRKEAAKKLEERLRALMQGGLTLILVCLLALAPGAALAAEPYIPATYEELLTYYRESLSILQEYHDLYAKAEASNLALLKANEELRSLVERQQKVIVEDAGRRRFGAVGGVILLQQGPGVLFGVQYNF